MARKCSVRGLRFSLPISCSHSFLLSHNWSFAAPLTSQASPNLRTFALALPSSSVAPPRWSHDLLPDSILASTQISAPKRPSMTTFKIKNLTLCYYLSQTHVCFVFIVLTTWLIGWNSLILNLPVTSHGSLSSHGAKGLSDVLLFLWHLEQCLTQLWPVMVNYYWLSLMVFFICFNVQYAAEQPSKAGTHGSAAEFAEPSIPVSIVEIAKCPQDQFRKEHWNVQVTTLVNSLAGGPT